MKIVAHEQKGSDWLLTLERRSVWRWLFCLPEKRIRVIGADTVWRYYPSFKRCGSMMECALSDMCEKLAYEVKHGKAK